MTDLIKVSWILLSASTLLPYHTSHHPWKLYWTLLRVRAWKRAKRMCLYYSKDSFDLAHQLKRSQGPLVCSLLSHVWLFCDFMDCSLPGSSVHGISQARILEWVAPMPSSRGSTRPGIEPASLISPALTGRSFITNAIWEAPGTLKSPQNTLW